MTRRDQGPPRPDPGGDFEDLIKSSAKAFKPNGLRLRKFEPTVIGKHGADGRVSGHVQGAGPLDFEGWFGPLWVGIEAKSTDKPRFPLDKLTKGQPKRIRDAHEDGAIALLLIEWRTPTTPRYFAVDWPALEPWWTPYDLQCKYGDPGATARARGITRAPASIPFAEIAAASHEVQRAGKVLDVLAPIRWLAERQAAARGGAA